MTSSLNKNSQKIQTLLSEQGFSCLVQELPSSTRTAKEAACAIGCSVEQIAKSLLFIDKESNRPLLFIVSGHHDIDLQKIEQEKGLCLFKASATCVKETTGFAIGGVPPIGHKEKIQTFLDLDLKRNEWIWAAAGSPFSVFRLRSEELQKMTGGEFIAMAKDS